MKMFVNFHPVLKIFIPKLFSSSYKLSSVFTVSISTSPLCFRNFRSPIKFTRFSKVAENEPENNITEQEAKDRETGEEELDKLIDKTFLLPSSGHQVLVIQPYIKWGPRKKRNTTPKLQLLESVTLIKTLRQWKVVEQMTVSLETFGRKYLFGRGKLRALKEKIQNSSTISAVFISCNTLKMKQQCTLEEVFGVPVFDRYTIVMHIFMEHARTREAKLQVQLAQLPYLWNVIKWYSPELGSKLGVSGRSFGGDGPKQLSERKEVFKAREVKLKREILQLRQNREMLRKVRQKHEIPIIAVVGYTNSGKTSLVKALTGKKTLEPQDYLFATLDVTSHLGELPSGLSAYFVDTLGFISDIPTYLIESFVSTLEDATVADLIIHVRDISHPDTVAQNDIVLSTLKSLDVSENTMGNILTVGNKIDLVPKDKLMNYRDLLLVSCAKMTGIDVLRREVEKRILLLGDMACLTIRVETGGPEYEWLHQASTIVDETPDSKNTQFIFLNVIISNANLSKFKHNFIKMYKKR